jgi:hypothetical protein
MGKVAFLTAAHTVAGCGTAELKSVVAKNVLPGAPEYHFEQWISGWRHGVESA